MERQVQDRVALDGEQGSTTIQLHSGGDATLIIRADTTKRFLVSSTILRLASKYFNALFSSSFKEGQAIQRGECPDITLQDDDPEAMEIILSLLHYRFEETYETLEPEMLAKVARQSDKYQCNLPLRPWISQWIRNARNVKPYDARDYGFLLTAAYLFGVPEHLESVSIATIRNVPATFQSTWEDNDLFSLLSREIRDEIESQIWKTINDIRFEVESVECFLRATSKAYKMQRMLCTSCGRLHPASARQCHPCRNEGLYPEICTSQTRIADYFKLLRRHALWPTTTAFREYSISDLSAAISGMVDDRHHQCDAGLNCPLKEEVNILQLRVKADVKLIRGIRWGHGVVINDSDGERSASADGEAMEE